MKREVPIQITSISVKKLFGMFDHRIPLRSTERVTIIHGPNGFGKTVMLRMIAALFDGTKEIFEHTPFDEFRIEFSDGSARVIRRTVQQKGADPRPDVKLHVIGVDSAGMETPMPDALINIPKPTLDRMDRAVPSPYRRFREGWVDDTGRVYSAADIMTRFPRTLEVLPRRLRPKLFPDIAGIPSVFFVETNRLGARSSSAPVTHASRYAAQLGFDNLEESNRNHTVLRVEEYSQDVAQRIQAVLTEYAKHSQERDRSFPERLVQFFRESTQARAEREILDEMSDLEKRRQRLISLGFLDSETGLRDLAEADVRRAKEALTIYVEDVTAKLKVFDEMADRVGKLMDIINDRFRYKNLRIHRERGFCVISDSGDSIQLSDLSSGEQHELVVLYELLFRTPVKGLVLVDEPEISLHVGWQSRFLADLIGILELTNAYAIVATHSPMIVGTRWDLTVELTGPGHEAAKPGGAAHA